MGEARHGLVKVDAAEPVEAKKAQEGPGRGDQVLSRARARLFGPIEHECPDASRVPLIQILAESTEQVSGTTTVMPESGGCSPSVSPEPFAKRGDQSGLSIRPGALRLRLAHPDSAQVTVKSLGSKHYVMIGNATVGQRTATP